MIDVETALYNILHAVYGEEVRQSLHDGLYEVNQNSLEAVAKAIGIAIDSNITSTTSSSTGYVTGALVLNNVSWDFWKCTGTNTWVLQGNIKGANGEPGEQGEPGEDGAPGSVFHKGTGITGTSTTPTIFSGSGVVLAGVTDVYLNTATGILYQCTAGGVATVAEWVYLMTFGEAGAVDWPTLVGKPFGSVDVTQGLEIVADALRVDLAKVERKASTLTSKATVVLTDEMVITDSTDSNISKRSPFSALKTLFDTLYNNYVLPTATALVKGGIKIGNGLVIDSEIVRVDKYTFANVAVATTDFATYTASGTVETDLTTAGYVRKVHKALTGVTADHVASVVFGAVEADNGNYASVVTTEAGYVNIYAKAVPASAITIPTIDCTYKGV